MARRVGPALEAGHLEAWLDRKGVVEDGEGAGKRAGLRQLRPPRQQSRGSRAGMWAGPLVGWAWASLEILDLFDWAKIGSLLRAWPWRLTDLRPLR